MEKGPYALDDALRNPMPSAKLDPLDGKAALSGASGGRLRDDERKDLVRLPVTHEHGQSAAERRSAMPTRSRRCVFLTDSTNPSWWGEAISARCIQGQHRALRESRQGRSCPAGGRSLLSTLVEQCGIEFPTSGVQTLRHLGEIALLPESLPAHALFEVDRPPRATAHVPRSQVDGCNGKDEAGPRRGGQHAPERHQVLAWRTEAVKEDDDGAVAASFPIAATGDACVEVAEFRESHEPSLDRPGAKTSRNGYCS